MKGHMTDAKDRRAASFSMDYLVDLIKNKLRLAAVEDRSYQSN